MRGGPAGEAAGLRGAGRSGAWCREDSSVRALGRCGNVRSGGAVGRSHGSAEDGPAPRRRHDFLTVGAWSASACGVSVTGPPSETLEQGSQRQGQARWTSSSEGRRPPGSPVCPWRCGRGVSSRPVHPVTHALRLGADSPASCGRLSAGLCRGPVWGCSSWSLRS